MGDATGIENQVSNAVNIPIDISGQIGDLAEEVERIGKQVDSIERQTR